MKRLIINNYIHELSEKYVKEMCYNKPHKDGSVSNSYTMLVKLIKKISLPTTKIDTTSITSTSKPTKASIVQYLNNIKNNYIDLLNCHPQKYNYYITQIFKINPETISQIKIIYQPSKGSSKRIIFLHEEIVRCMRYSYIQSAVFPKYIRAIGIKTCVYCNAQYALTTKKDESLYQLDHCFPKSKYPFLSANFFNLQPCCGPCNIRKSDNEMIHGKYNVSIWLEDGEDNTEDLFNFKLSDLSIVNYLCSLQNKDLNILFATKSNSDFDLKKLADDFNKILIIKRQYEEHKDVAEEILWKKCIYSSGYLESLRSAFNFRFGKLKSELSRLIMGTYMNPNDIYKRPLSKMIQDISRQLNIDFEDNK